MQTGSIPGEIPISFSGEVQTSTRSGEIGTSPASTVPIEQTGQITVETPDYLAANNVGHIVDVVV